MVIGTTRQQGPRDLVVSEDDRKDVWKRYLQLHPTFKVVALSLSRFQEVPTVREWVGLRPERPEIRVEAQWRKVGSRRFLVGVF